MRMTGPAGLYIHLPYCRSRCGYCAFVVTTDDSSREAYLAALSREIDLLADEAQGALFDSVYLGGGTPSLVPIRALVSLTEALERRFVIEPGAEITLEANPDDVTRPLARAWREAGITRVSLGVQSFEDRELAAVGRRHDAADAARSLETLSAEGLSVSGDLILGLPDQTPETFRASATRLAAAGVGHISVYLLETEKSRILEDDRRANPWRYLSDDRQADLWLELCALLARRGFRHYEISNWALAGRQARHNLKYWKRSPTLGLGIAAHELWEEHRRANVSAIPAYLESLAAGRRALALDREIDQAERARERIVLGLRLEEGIDRDELESWVRAGEDSDLWEDYGAWRDAGWLEATVDRVRLTERGFLISNEILCRFV